MGSHVLKLYVAGRTSRGDEAVTAIREMCDRELQDDYELVVVDVLERPQVAATDRILATPTLVKEMPPPRRRVVGDLSDTARVLAGLELAGKPAEGMNSAGDKEHADR
jgi:circadian clock protein KaiB